MLLAPLCARNTRGPLGHAARGPAWAPVLSAHQVPPSQGWWQRCSSLHLKGSRQKTLTLFIYLFVCLFIYFWHGIANNSHMAGKDCTRGRMSQAAGWEALCLVIRFFHTRFCPFSAAATGVQRDPEQWCHSAAGPARSDLFQPQRRFWP